MTRQRRVILEELSKARTHPTADEVYARVRRRLPRISLGTVYRNLETLSARGLIGKLEVAGTQKRFDGDAGRHHHVRCIRCGLIADALLEDIDAVASAIGEVEGYEITGYRLELLGRCPRCRGKGSQKRQDSRKE